MMTCETSDCKNVTTTNAKKNLKLNIELTTHTMFREFSKEDYLSFMTDLDNGAKFVSFIADNHIYTLNTNQIVSVVLLNPDVGGLI